MGADHDLVLALRERLAALDRLIQEHRMDDRRAADALAVELREKLEKLNEFRGALSDAQAHMVGRDEYAATLAALQRELSTLQGNGQKYLTRADYEPRHNQLETALGTLGSRLDRFEATQAGQLAGVASVQRAADRNRTLLFAIVGVVLTVLGVFTFDLRQKQTIQEVPATPTTTTVRAP